MELAIVLELDNLQQPVTIISESDVSKACPNGENGEFVRLSPICYMYLEYDLVKFTHISMRRFVDPIVRRQFAELTE
jgi:hypothetical protein